MTDYQKFLESKTHRGAMAGFDPVFMAPGLFDFQQSIVDWAVRLGRAAIFADCGLGKTPMQLTWAQNVVEKTNKPVLILTPLAVAQQTIRESAKFGVEAVHRRDGMKSKDRIVVTNYERLHYFNPADFSGVVLDESSILKCFTGKTRMELTSAWKDTPYRLACTATPAPNDLMEIGNHAEFLGVMRGCEMLSAFFINDPGSVGKYRLKGHAAKSFWQWVSNWAAYLRKPSDLGFKDDGYDLPPLRIHDTTIDAAPEVDGQLFPSQAFTLKERQSARRNTIQARSEVVAEIANKLDSPFIAWCNLNAESDCLKSLIPDCVEVRGSDSDSAKEDRLNAFANGQVRVLVSKPSIAGMGMNFQHCSSMAFTGLSDSFEQYYQAVRRCWRFGQNNPVDCWIVTDLTEGAVVENVRRKEADANLMAEQMRHHMISSRSEWGSRSKFLGDYLPNQEMEIPSWLK
jgi:superfamily II DNA or RNA helicase